MSLGQRRQSQQAHESDSENYLTEDALGRVVYPDRPGHESC